VVTGPPADGLAGVIHVGGISSDHVIRPTAIILHWWGAVANSDIYSLIDSLNGQTGYYEPWLTKSQYLYNEANGIDGHHLGVQFAVTRDGRMWQLTPYANSYAAHAACGNGWAVGIEIEGRGPADLHSDPTQFASVVRLTGELMKMFGIPLDGPIAANGLSGTGVHSHKQVDLHCYFADGSFAGVGKVDVDDAYLAEVKAALANEGF
jgi:hypothetical protein